MTATNAMARHVELCVEGETDPASGFERDLAAMTAVAAGGPVVARLWSRPQPGIALGRFQRREPSAPEALERRLSGGRYLAVGPGVLGLTLVLPSVAWLAPGARPLAPDQVLNRALRPLLAVLRKKGLDAFYPGRDLVTVTGRPVAHAAFTVLPDGVTLVEMAVDLAGAWREAGALLSALDPAAVAGADLAVWQDACGVAELGARVSPKAAIEDWKRPLVDALAQGFACDVSEQDGRPGEGASIVASPEAWRAFLAERGPLAPGARVAVGFAMLGVVEASARLEGDRIYDLVVAGEVLAPHHTLEDLSALLEGAVHRGPQIRKALVQVLSRPRNFLLGANDLDALIERLS